MTVEIKTAQNASRALDQDQTVGDFSRYFFARDMVRSWRSISDPTDVI